MTVLVIAIALATTAGVITGYLLGIAVGESRETAQHLDDQAKRLGLPPYHLTSDERWSH